MTNLPVYQCHKRVQAARIVSVNPNTGVVNTDGSVAVALPDQPSFSIAVPLGFFSRSVPEPGDYLVIYDDGYMSHSPKAAFEAGYHAAAASLSFGDAIAALKAGKRVARAGWNGKGMWLKLILSGDYQLHREIDTALYEARQLSWIGMKTADNKFVPWLASQTDMLADDWCVVE